MKLHSSIIIMGILISPPLFAYKNCNLPTGLNVHPTKQTLNICENGKVIREYRVSLGRNGIGKRQAGDKKTPIGLYRMGFPYKSNRFGTFIPIQYPTIQQRAAGYTGKDVGIHGPYQLFAWFGSINTWFNWTQGCIAVKDDTQISFISNWVKNHPGTQILIDG